MKDLFRHIYTKYVIAFIIGGLIGYIYYYFTSCSTGACPLKSNPYIPVILFGLLGTSFVKKKKNENT
jgi:hypothetical protein